MSEDKASGEVSHGQYQPRDPKPYEIVNPEGRARLLLLCDHASPSLPARAQGLGLNHELLARHIAWDIGAADVTRRLSMLLDAPAVLSGVSRLYIDVNRSPNNPTSIIPVSDGIEIPGNHNVSVSERNRRISDYFSPYHRAAGQIGSHINLHAGTSALVTIHSFTPVMDGFERPWHIGVLWDRDSRLAAPLLSYFKAKSAIRVGDNEPYSGYEPESYSLVTHGAAHGRPHVELEIKQNLINTERGIEEWAKILSEALGHLLPDNSLFEEAYF